MSIIKVSDYVMRFLYEKGIRYAFMLPGGGAMHLVDSLGQSKIEYIPFLHEQAAAIAAEAYAQHTNSPSFTLVTSGPGATNAITAVTAGWIDSTPMIVISGQAKRSDLVGDTGVRQIGSQEVQIVEMVRSVTKYAVQVMDSLSIRYHMERAWHEAVSGRPGPVWLSIPLDVQGMMVDIDGLEAFEKKNEAIPDISQAVQDTITLLRQAQKPLILAGNGIKLSGATEDFYALLKYLQVPVETTWKSIDLFDERDPLYVGHPGIMGDRGANLILQEADCFLSIGSRLDTSITAFNEGNFAKNAKKILIDIDVKELDRMHMDAELKICCDAALFLRELLAVLKKSVSIEKKSWLQYCKKIHEKYSVVSQSHTQTEKYVSAYYFIDRLCDLLREDDVIVPESSGAAGEITYQAFRIKKGQRMKNAAGLGSMGFGLPYAIGACLANQKRRTILIDGDGAFQLNIQELETLHRLQLPVKMFIWCNGGYASIRAMQRNNFQGRYVASEKNSGLTMPDIGRVAAAYGFNTCCVHNSSELETLLPKVLSDDQPVLCMIMVDPDETVSPKVKAYLGENGKMMSGLLESMWPPL